MDKIEGSDELEDDNEGGEAENRAGAELEHLATKKCTERDAEMVDDVAESVVFELVAVINGVDIVTVTDVFIGSRAEESPGQREEADEITTREKSDGEKNATDAELDRHGEIVAFWGEIFEGEDTNKVGGKTDDEEIIGRNTGGETERIGEHKHFQSNGSVIGGAGEKGIDHITPLEFVAKDVAQGGKLRVVWGFFGNGQVETIHNNASND